MVGVQDMEQPEEGLNQDIGESMVTENHEFEFVVVGNTIENDNARVEPAVDTENHQQPIQNSTEDWDDNGTYNAVAPEVNPFPLSMNSELDYPNFEQLSVEAANGEWNMSYMSSELCTDEESSRLGTLRFYVTIDNVDAFCRFSHGAQSDIFQCRGLSFRLSVHNRLQSIEPFLMRERTNDETIDNGMDIVVSCDISLMDPITDNIFLTKSFSNHVMYTGSDWGFTDYVKYHTIAMRQQNCVKFCVTVKADPPYCHSHKSKAITGFVGIRNQGATCYMNSLLQVLFFVNKFRTACYRIPTEMDDKTSMALALQKVFYNLQFSDTPACTQNLTKSFGWSTVDVLMQHDVQEMMRLLIEKVESRMKNTLLEPILPSIFQGRFVSYVKCRDIEFTSQREEVFYDIQLSLENAQNVYDSFKRYVSPELMDDENKYHAGTHGLQAAEKGTLFLTLPPVMFLHLLRFQFDGTTNQVMKNNNFYEFYKHIDLTEFVREDEHTSWKYTLFAVLSHSGGGSHGHYVAYINPSLNDTWLKFDDDIISMVHECDAIQSNYGSKGDVDEWTRSMQLNAYMLVYVRDSEATDIFAKTDPKFISDELKSAVKMDVDEQNYHNLIRYHHSTDIYLFLSALLESDMNFPLARDERSKEMPKFPIGRDVTVSTFKGILMPIFKLSSPNQIRIWPIVHASSQQSHPVYINEDAPLVHTVSAYRCKYSAFYTVWLEMALPGEELPPFDPAKNVLVFYSYYCPMKCRQFYVHHGYYDKNANISELIPVMNELMAFSPDRELNMYQVLRGRKINELNSQLGKFSEYVPAEGDTMVMHVVFEAKDHDTSTTLNSISLYYQDLLLRATLTVTNVDNLRSEETFDISLQSTFPELLERIAGRLQHDVKRIQIFHSYSNGPADAILSSTTGTLKELLNGSYQKFHLFYKLHTIDVCDMEMKRHFKFYWLSIDMKQQKPYTLYLNDGETIEQILAEAAEIICSDPTHGTGKYRALFVNECQVRIVKDANEIYKHIDEISADYQQRYRYRIEEIPIGDDILNDNERFVQVFQWRVTLPEHRENFIPPFIFKVNFDDSWHTIKDRLRNRLHLSEAYWSNHYRPMILTTGDEELIVPDDTKRLLECVEPNSMFSIRLKYKYKSFQVQNGQNRMIKLQK